MNLSGYQAFNGTAGVLSFPILTLRVEDPLQLQVVIVEQGDYQSMIDRNHFICFVINQLE